MDQVHVIRHKVRVEGRSVRRVAQELGVSRNTVRRYLDDTTVIGERKPSGRAKPKQDALAKLLPVMMEESKRWTERKQRLTAMRLHELVLAKGIVVGYTLVKEAFREWKRRGQEVYVPLVYRAGDLGEVDFFEVVVDVAGQRQKAWMFLLRLMCSGRDFAWLYPRQDQVCFLDGHVRAFAHFGGSPNRLLYDNLKPAVARVLVGAERQMTARFQALATHYAFEPCFARPGTGHDKGGVESRGRAIRLQHLVPIPVGKTLDEISQALLVRLDSSAAEQMRADGKSVMDAFAEEKSRMIVLPSIAFASAAVRLVQVSRRSLVKVEGATYSVPCAWAGLQATAYVGVDEVDVVGPGGERVQHRRQRFGGRSIDYRHYLPELARKPAATRQVAEELMASLGSPFVEAWASLVDQLGPRDGARVMSRLLAGIVDMGIDVVAERVRSAMREGRPLQFALLMTAAPPPSLPSDELPASLQSIQVVSGKARDYDVLLGGAL